MGHATHFLERVERLSSPQADFALELYRNSALVRFILEKSRLPDGAERVALGVDEQPGGPHIIVTRDGAFVTCLGAGMSTNDLPVLTRGRIERLGSRYEAIHEAVARTRDAKELDRLYRNLARRGAMLSREDFAALAALMPIMEDDCVQMVGEMLSAQLQFQNRFTRRKYRRLDDRLEEQLRYYSDGWWAVGHLLMLCGTRGPELCMPHDGQGADRMYALSQISMYGLCLPVMLRAGWTAARVGRDMVASAKQQVRNAAYFVDLLCRALPLVAVGLRHRSARAEVQKFIGRTRRALETTMSAPAQCKVADPVLERFEQAFDPEDAAAMLQAHRKMGAAYAVRIVERLPEGHPLRYASAEEVPDEVALAVPMYINDDLIRTTQHVQHVLTVTLPWLASADAADLYLPADVIEAFGDGWNQWDPERTVAHLDARYRYLQLDRPARAQPKPGRNDPCSCGSGKKYKRCCGA